MCVKNTYQRLDRIQIWRPEDGLMNHNFPFHFSRTSYLKSKIHNTHENAHIQNPSSFSYQLNVLSSPAYTHTHIYIKLVIIFQKYMVCWYSYPLAPALSCCWGQGTPRQPDLGCALHISPSHLCVMAVLLPTSHKYLKSSFQEYQNNISPKTYAIIFRLYTWIMQTPDLHLLGSKLFE